MMGVPVLRDVMMVEENLSVKYLRRQPAQLADPLQEAGRNNNGTHLSLAKDGTRAMFVAMVL